MQGLNEVTRIAYRGGHVYRLGGDAAREDEVEVWQ